jgi:hypothetical protein
MSIKISKYLIHAIFPAAFSVICLPIFTPPTGQLAFCPFLHRQSKKELLLK